MDHIADVHRDGQALLDAARSAGLDAPIEACPGWDVARLLGHTGRVLWRNAVVVREGLDAPPDPERFVRFPATEEAFTRFADVLADAVDALGTTDASTACWNFTGEDLNAGFWQRRTANELAIHRVDAEQAAGTIQPVDPERAVDGIDELLTVLLSVSAAGTHPGLDASFHLHCTDVDGEWLTVFTDGRPTTTREHAKGDLAVRGPSSPLFLWAWNRATVGTDGIESFGDPALLDVWATITP